MKNKTPKEKGYDQAVEDVFKSSGERARDKVTTDITHFAIRGCVLLILLGMVVGCWASILWLIKVL